MTWLFVVLAGASWIATIVLMRRLTRHRKYDREQPATFAAPYLSIFDTLNRANYTPEGEKLVPWVVVSLLTLTASFLAAFWRLV
jgi:hypothetical protein